MRATPSSGSRSSSSTGSRFTSSDNGFRNSSAVRSTRPASDNGFRNSSAVRSTRPASDNGFRNSSAVRAHAGHSGFEAAPLGGANLARGASGASVRALQDRLRASGFDPGVSDGRFGPRTDRALRDYQNSRGLAVDGIAGPRTFAALNGGASATTAMRPGTGEVPSALGAGGARTATIDSITGPRRSQMASGRITVNGNVYQFNSGGQGRGSLPTGSYEITAHRWSRNDPTMQVGGVGYSFAMSDKYDPRVGDTRTLMRIHPDGGSAGTHGCMGIVGNAEVQRRFREDMRAELERSGGRFTLNVS